MNEEFSGIKNDRSIEGFSFMDERMTEQLELLETLWVDFYNKPVSKNGRKLETGIELHFETIDVALATLRGEYKSDDAALKPLLTYVMDLEQRRIDILNELDDGNEYDFPDNTTPDGVYEMLKEQEFDAQQKASEFYKLNMQSDMEMFNRAALKSYVEKPSTIRTERAKIVGKHALDIAKVGAGVLGGLLVAKKAKLL